ncbi:UNVERIFIED_CONTAM: hypothetical protein FKN15_035409 [Acipenser sinensis]
MYLQLFVLGVSDQKYIGFEVSPDEFEPAASGIDDHTNTTPMSPREELGKDSDEPDARASLPTPSDILVLYSTFPGYVSWRDTQAGSWYVETLDNVLEEFAGYDDLLTLLTMPGDRRVKALHVECRMRPIAWRSPGKGAPRGVQDAPYSLEIAGKGAPRGVQDAPYSLEIASKGAPRGVQDAPYSLEIAG